MTNRVTYRDWVQYTRDLGAVLFEHVTTLEKALTVDKILVGVWDNRANNGWIRSMPAVPETWIS